MRASLCGENLVRLAFLDESGRSRHEPIIVVAGIVLNGDRTYRKLCERLSTLIEEFIPEQDRGGFVFHAKDIFQGTGYFKDRTQWPREEKRFPILTTIAAIPRQFGMPVIFGYLNKGEYQAAISLQLSRHERQETKAQISDVAEHMVAFAHAEIAIERQMHQFSRDEICMVIAEDTDRVKRALKSAHAILRDPQEIVNSGFAGLSGLPLQKIVDTPHFAEKAESAPLQVADCCAYLIMRRLMRRDDSQQFFELLAPQLTWAASDSGDPMGSERERFGTGSLY
jgi:hypothetical protein